MAQLAARPWREGEFLLSLPFQPGLPLTGRCPPTGEGHPVTQSALSNVNLMQKHLKDTPKPKQVWLSG